MITILTWVAIFSGGLLILLLLLSILGGMDLELDVDFDVSLDVDVDADVDVDSGGLGVIKGGLAFLSIGAWVARIALSSERGLAIALGIGVVAGLIAFWILHYIMKLLLRNEENVNWEISDALYQKGKVYLTIPGNGKTGIVQVDIRGAFRELKAKSKDSQPIKTGEEIVVVDFDDEFVIVDRKQ